MASERTLEQKICDAGPSNQRIDPHILTEARHALVEQGIIVPMPRANVSWYHLAGANSATVKKRFSLLNALHQQTQGYAFTQLLGQALEIAVYRALTTQEELQFFGMFEDLEDHDDSRPYHEEEPPSSLSGRQIPDRAKLDFLIQQRDVGYAGIEVKNIRQWIYPNRLEVVELLAKCCCLDVVPVLIARRIHFSTFSVLNPCGVILHQTYNQLYPASAQALAEKVKDKNLLGYHDIRVGNNPDARLIRFIHENLPKVLIDARQIFDNFKDLLCGYASGELDYSSFSARVKRRERGEREDFPEGEPEPEPEDY